MINPVSLELGEFFDTDGTANLGTLAFQTLDGREDIIPGDYYEDGGSRFVRFDSFPTALDTLFDDLAVDDRMIMGIRYPMTMSTRAYSSGFSSGYE